MNRYDHLSSSGADYIRTMFADTHEGLLTIGDDDHGTDTLSLDWDEAAMEATVTEFNALQDALTRLGTLAPGETPPEALAEIYNTYLLPYPRHGMDPELLLDLSLKAEIGEPLTETETTLLEAEDRWLQENALTRLPQRRCNPSALIQRARRYVKLLQLQAPRIVTASEACYLAEEMVLYHFLSC